MRNRCGQAERNLDINVKNDESHATEKNRTQYVGEDETLRVAKIRKAGVKGMWSA